MPDILTENSKRFWSYFRAKTQTKCLPSKICHEGVSATNLDDMACMFNTYFKVAPNNNPGVSSAVPDIDEYKNMYLSNILFTESDVLKVLSSLDGSEACGPDVVSPAVLKQCAKEWAPSLVTLFNLSMKQSKVPTSWKLAIPVHKKGDRDPVSNYRLISLLGIVSKVMEKCIDNHVSIITNNLICSEQDGFIKGKSCSTQLTGVYHEIGFYFGQFNSNRHNIFRL